MILLKLVQEDYEKNLAVFDSLDDGRNFLKKFADHYVLENIGGFDLEYLVMDGLEDYFELEYRGNIIPFSRFAFPSEERVEIFWDELPNLSIGGQGMLDISLRVDAYLVDGHDMREYIEKREDNFKETKDYLVSKGYQVQRAFLGSEDGEAILVRKEQGDWRFLMHMDPFFVREDDIITEVKRLMDEF